MAGFKWAVYEADFDPVSGAEQSGTRPVLVVSNEEFNQAMPNVTVLPLTSTSRRLYPSETWLRANTAGQPLDSIIMAHQIRTISKSRLKRLMGHLKDETLHEDVRSALREHLEL